MPSPAAPTSSLSPLPLQTAHAPPPVHYVASSPPAAWADALAAAVGFLYAAVAALAAAAARALVWAGGALLRAVVWLVARVYATAAWPARRGLAFLRFLLSPVTYTVAYAVAPVGYVVRFLGQFQPLYTYLGAAAFIGIVTGLVLKLACHSFFAAVWPVSDEEGEEEEEYGLAVGQHSSSSAPTKTPPGTSGAPRQASGVKKGGPDGQPPDDVWLWLEEFNPPAPAVATAGSDGAGDAAHALLPGQKPRPGGLLSLTILEESSTE